MLDWFRKKKGDVQEKDVVAQTKNWYADRYQTVIIQRNILVIITLVALVSVFLSVVVVQQVANKKTIEPFVIEIEEKSGITSLVDPSKTEKLYLDEALKKYFIVRYLRARETYDPADYQYNYFTVVPLFSARHVYRTFRDYVRNSEDGPVNKYGQRSKTTLKIRSIQFFKNGKNAQVRFQIQEEGRHRKTYNKIATMDFDYVLKKMTQEERHVNPLGFEVQSYRVDDETL